jgi:hypothetical protein
MPYAAGMVIRFVTFVVVCLGLLAYAPAATAGDEPPPPPKCFRSNGMGDLPTCTWNGRSWQVSYDDRVPVFDDGFMSPGLESGIPSAFVAFAVLVVLAGAAATVWRVSLARQVARDAGMDPDRATAMTLLSDDGLDATYLAANLRTPATPSAPPPVDTVRSPEDRLRQLQQLHDGGLVSAEEYDERRRAILDSL